MKRQSPRAPIRPEIKREATEPGSGRNETVNSQNPGKCGKTWSCFLGGAIIVLAIILAYQPAWNAGFIWDDDAYIIHNKLLTEPGGLARIWFSQDSPSQYFPLVYTVFKLERGLWGLNPSGYHWVNILLHAANSLLVWQILSRLRIPGCWLAAALFALHPVQVESVAWVTELKNILSVLFSLLAVLTWIKFLDRPARPWLFYFGALFFYLLALFSKTTACTLPAALLLVVWLTGQPLNRKRAVQILPFIIFGFSMGLLTMWWERHHIGTSGETFSIGPVARVLIASRAIWFYLGKLLWPASLAFSYPQFDTSLANPVGFISLAAVLVCAVVLWFWRKRIGYGAGAALFFFVATLSPMLGFIMLYTFKYTFVADHYQYAAAIGPLALLAALIVRVPNAFPPRENVLRIIVFTILVLAFGSLTWRRATAFQNAESIWRDTIAKNPKSWLAFTCLGDELLHRGEFDEAIELYNRAIELNPTDVNAMVSAGNAYFGRNRYTEAAALYSRALGINPANPESHVNLAVILANEGKLNEAIDHDRAALRLNPKHVAAHVNLAVSLARQGNYPEALEHYREAIAINPERPLNRINMAITLEAMGKHDEANEQYKIAAHQVNRYAESLAQQGRNLEAESQYLEAIKMIPNNAEAHFGLGRLLLTYGKEVEARAHLEAALKIRPDYSEAQQLLRKISH